MSWHLRQPVGEMLLGKGIFAVPSTAVAGRSRHSYCSLLAQVSGCRHCEAGHYLERVWHAVFGGTRAFNSPPIEDLEKEREAAYESRRARVYTRGALGERDPATGETEIIELPSPLATLSLR